MAGTYTGLTTITSCEVATGFSVDTGSFALTSGPSAEGSNFVYHYRGASAGNANFLRYDNGSGIDLSNGELFFIYFIPGRSSLLQNKDAATPGCRFHLEDTSGNWKRWNVSGKDVVVANNYLGGLIRCALDPSSTSDSSSGTLSLSAIRYYEVKIDYASGSGAGLSTSVDHFAYGRGIICTGGGTGGSPLDFTDVKDGSDASGWAILRTRFGDVFELKGDVKFDSTAADIHFESVGQTIEVPEQRGALEFEVGIYGSSNVPRIIIDESGANDTNVVFGDETSEVNGLVLINDSQNPVIECDTAITKFKILGCVLTCDWDITGTANPVIKNTTLSGCGEYPLGTRTFEGNVIISATSGVLMGASHVSKDNNYLSCTDAIHVSDNGPLTVTLDGDTFSGNTDDIHFSGTGTLTVNNSNGSNASSSRVSGGGTVVIQTPVDITITVIDADGDAIQDAQTSVQLLDSPFTQLMNEDTLVTGVATETYIGTVPVDVVVKVRKSATSDDPRYVAYSRVQVIGTDGLTLVVTLETQPLPI